MTRLKLEDLADEKPRRLTVEVSAKLYQELLAYAVAINGGETKGAPPVERIVPPMLERFMITDRGFAKARKSTQPG